MRFLPSLRPMALGIDVQTAGCNAQVCALAGVDMKSASFVPKNSLLAAGCACISKSMVAGVRSSSASRGFFICSQLSCRPLDVAAVQQAAGHLVGEHDFRNFCKMDVEKVHTFRRGEH